MTRARMKFRFATALLSASLIHSVLALNIHVSPNGSDDRPGTAGTGEGDNAVRGGDVGRIT